MQWFAEKEEEEVEEYRINLDCLLLHRSNFAHIQIVGGGGARFQDGDLRVGDGE